MIEQWLLWILFIYLFQIPQCRLTFDESLLNFHCDTWSMQPKLFLYLVPVCHPYLCLPLHVGVSHIYFFKYFMHPTIIRGQVRHIISSQPFCPWKELNFWYDKFPNSFVDALQCRFMERTFDSTAVDLDQVILLRLLGKRWIGTHAPIIRVRHHNWFWFQYNQWFLRFYSLWLCLFSF